MRYLFILALLAGVSVSADEKTESSYSVSADFTYSSKYVFRGIQLASGSLQPSVKMEVHDTAYLSVWANKPVNSKLSEVDYSAGLTPKISDHVTTDLGVVAYTYPDDSGSNSHEWYAGINAEFGNLSGSAYAYRDFSEKITTGQVTAGYSVDLGKKASFGLLATAGRVSASEDSYTYWSVGASVPVKINDHFTLTTGAQYSSHNLNKIEKNHVWFTIGLTVSS